MISLSSPTKTRAHQWPAGAKLLGLCGATVWLFSVDSVLLQFCVFISVLVLYALPGRAFFVAGLRQLKVLWPFVLIVGIWHCWTGETLLGGAIILRMLSAVGMANLVTMTTRLSDMTEVVQTVLAPMRRVGLNSRALEIAIALVIRLTPVLAERGSQLSTAWKARSKRASSWRIILPFTVIALDDADHVAEALRARGGFSKFEES